ncbi:DUF4752 family protein [Rosenbergiella epipactidis]|uniref:DUF4752 family protein n=1 Tax=Rosenbergiella epipactidis TaxID=1544694 RepID=UPI001F4DDFB4|nr:DUF4752 family protein [Rosenbergiella epipactidis]
MSVSEMMTIGIGGVGYVYIVAKAFDWFVCTFFKSLIKLRREKRGQKAVNEILEVYGVEKLSGDESLTITTRAGMTITMRSNKD